LRIAVLADHVGADVAGMNAAAMAQQHAQSHGVQQRPRTDDPSRWKAAQLQRERRHRVKRIGGDQENRIRRDAHKGGNELVKNGGIRGGGSETVCP
jgi:hypothetical protein